MIRVLYIGDPSSVHDIKWVSYFSTRPDFEAFFLVQEHEMHLMTAERKAQYAQLAITVVGPIKSYSLWRFWENRASINTIREIIATRKIDVVHPLFATPFSLWTQHSPVPSVITCRGSDIHVVLAGLGNGAFVSRLHGKLLLQRFKKAFTEAAAITCTSQGQLTRINQIFHTDLKAEIVRTGVNVDEIDRLKPSMQLPSHLTGKRIIFLPRYMRPIYRTELQIRALMQLPQRLKQDVAVVLVKGNRTDEHYLNSVGQLLTDCGMPFHIFESLSQREMWSMFKISALAIMTPKTDGTPNSALEAMAAKCPLILGSFQYDEDLFSDRFCHRLKTDTEAELAHLIESSLDNYPKEKLEAAFVNASKFGNRPVEMERLRSIYVKLLQG